MTNIKPAYLDRESVAAFVSLSVPTMERMVEEWAESRPVSANLPVANCGVRHGARV